MKMDKNINRNISAKIKAITSAFLLFFILLSCINQSSSTGNLNNEDTIVLQSKNLPDTFSLIAVGDIMLGTLYPSDDYLPPKGDCGALLAPLKHILSDADLSFGNLEGVLTDTRDGAKKCNDPNTCYTFGMPTRFIDCIKDAGFDVLSLANNHTGDFGETGRRNTKKIIDEKGIFWAGLTEKPSVTFTVSGLTIGFCAFAPNEGTIQITDYVGAKKIVEELDKTCDIVIVSFHGGAEGKAHQHVTRNYETFLGQNRGNVYKFAHFVIDAGADIVLGHGPHVTRAVEVYKNKFITYSMGNFCTYSRINITGENGVAPIFKIYTDNTGKFIKAEITSTYQIKYQGGPKIDSEKRALKLIQKLSKEDFPENNLNIGEDGLITEKKM